MNPETQSRLQKFTSAAKAIIYDQDRMMKFLQMLGTKEGAVTAAKTVVAAIDQHKPVPDDIAPMVAMNAYLLMVDVAQEVMGRKPSMAIVKEVVNAILRDYAQGQQQPAAPAAQAPAGMLAQGVA